MTGQQLRNSILQEAIHGRLVPNVLQSGEKTGEELLKAILAERQKKENEEKGKKAKTLTLSTIEEEPWELPEGWCWCKLGDLVYMISGTSYGKGDVLTAKTDSCVRVLRGGNIIDEQILYCADDVFIPSSFFDETKTIKKNDIVIIGSSGSKKAIAKASLALEDDSSSQIGAFLRIIRNYNQSFLPYVWMIFRSAYYKLYIADIVKGTNINNIKAEYIEQFDIPFPPLSIQKAIVAKIEELLPLIDEYDKAAVELETLNKILPEKLRKSVLQEAIHGTLVPNDIPKGEATGAELLQQILKERQDKENKEKGKKAKKLTLSTIEEEPWDLPDGWCWTQIGDIFEHSAGKSLNSSKQSIGKVYPYLTTSNVYWDGINFEKVKEMAFTEEEYKKCSAIKNDILVCEGGDVGRSCIWTYDYTIGLQNHVHRLRAIKNVDVKFFYYVLRFYKANGIITAKGIGIGGFSANALKGLTVPLPPLSIQHRIVEKIEEVFSAITKL